MESMTIRVDGDARRARAATSRPLRLGIVMSRIATSGRSRSMRSNASRPSPVSPAIVTSGTRSRSDRSPSRNRVWSSASRTRTARLSDLDRNPGVDLRPTPGRRANVELPAHRRDPLLHAREAGVLPLDGTLQRRLHVEPLAVVRHADVEPAPIVTHRDCRAMRFGMADDVVEGLLHDPESGDRDVLGEIPGEVLADHVDREARAAGQGLDVPAERRREAELVEEGRTQIDR